VALLARQASMIYDYQGIEGLLEVGERVQSAMNTLKHLYTGRVESSISHDENHWYLRIRENDEEEKLPLERRTAYVEAVAEALRIAGTPQGLEWDAGKAARGELERQGRKVGRSWQDLFSTMTVK
jgi:hypothetical protein